MSTPSHRYRRPGRTPGTANLGVAVAVLAILVPLLLKASSGAPPAAAEFAPNADKIIKDAPPGQAAQAAGAGPQASASAAAASSAAAAASSAAAEASASPEPSKSLIPANLLKQCVGPPPLRQTEDPQSPPCVQYFDGDNGGATSPGVTKDTIYIVVPTNDNSGNHSAAYDALATYFNNRYEFYGRKIVFEQCSGGSSPGSGSADQPNEVADAALAATGCDDKHVPFASQFYRQANGPYYMHEMGCRYHVVSVGSYSPYDSTFLNQCQPYLYQYMMQTDDEFANQGEWACNRLVGGNAVHSGDYTGTKRKFGVIVLPFRADDPVASKNAVKPLTDRLHACGVDVASQDIIINPANGGTTDPAAGQNAILQLKQDGVTSVFCECNFLGFGTTVTVGAEASAYHPEWLTGSFGLNDVDSSFELGQAPVDQLAHTFGLSFHPPQITPLEEQYNVALQEGDPSQSPTTTLVEAKDEIYRGLLVLAAGIQMAGPNLTPATFAAGLKSKPFPNPITSVHAGAVGFSNSSPYSMTTDGVEWYWGANETPPDSGTTAGGTVCYVDGGTRHSLGDWPKGGDPFFTPPGTCSTGATY